jgi:hypothetical protein
MSIPLFEPDGLLPPGIHGADWSEVMSRFGASAYRQSLVNGFLEAARLLAFAGCRILYLDGSFVTDKVFPGDFDACWDPTGVDVSRLDPVFLDFSNRRAAQKARFRGELFLANAKADMAGNTFLEFFQIDKNTGGAKGIITLDLGGIP